MIPNTVVRPSSLKYLGSIKNTNPLTSSVNAIFVYAKDKAIDFFKFKFDLLVETSFFWHKPRSCSEGTKLRIAMAYGLTSRSIRDIWNHQSWGYATQCLWDKESEICRIRGKKLRSLEVSPYFFPKGNQIMPPLANI